MTDQYQEIEDKLNKEGIDSLTDEEIKIVMSQPNPEDSNVVNQEEVEEAFKGVELEDDNGIIIEDEDKDKDKEEDKSKDKKEDEKKSEPSKDKKDEKTPTKDEATIEGMDKINVELLKPEGSEDLSKLTPAEKGLFWELRRTRKRAQEAEKERDLLRLEKAKEIAKQEEEADKKGEEDDTDDDEFVTMGKIKKLLSSTAATKTETTETTFYRQTALKLFSEQAAAKYDDYSLVISLHDEIVKDNPEYQKEIAQAFRDGENPAVKMYNLIKTDPKFEKLKPVAEARVNATKDKAGKKDQESEEEKQRKIKEAKEAEDKLKENKDKPKTSAHHSGADTEGKVITAADLFNMSDSDFAKLSKEKREKILRKYGV